MSSQAVGMFAKKTIEDLKKPKGKTALVSVDYNVPGDEQGNVTDDYRIRSSIPTLEYLLNKGCKLILISHRDRPEGKVVSRFSLGPVAKRLSKLLSREVLFVDDCVGKEAREAKSNLKPGQILLLENTRFHPEEGANDKKFASELAEGADFFVQDAFGNSHREHASTSGAAHYLPSFAGLLLAKEVTTITEAIQHPKRPLMAIIGGAKIADKLDVLKNFIQIADIVAVGGAMANTFLLAEGIQIGESKADADDVGLAEDIIDLAKKEAKKRPFVFYLPQDGVVAKSLDKNAHTRIVDWSTHTVADIEAYPKQPSRESSKVAADELILDIGPFSGAFIAGSTQMVGTVIWNGVMGVTETAGTQGPVGPFAHGTELLLEALMGEFGNKPYSLIGGGDTSAYIAKRGLTECFDFVSTGGGAALNLMAGKKLPGVEALEDKKKRPMLYNKSKHKR